MKLRRKEDIVSFFIFGLFPIAMVVLVLAHLLIPVILLTCAYLAENLLYVIRFQREFGRTAWTLKLFFLRPVMHACVTLGDYKGLARLLTSKRLF